MPRILAAVAVLVIVGACSRQAPPAPPPPVVSVATPLLKNVVDWDEYIGHFEAPQSVELRARVTGQITRSLFHDGQPLRQGQPLFVIDPRPYKAALDQARAAVDSAGATRRNALSIAAHSAILEKTHAVSEEELETDQTQVRTATAAISPWPARKSGRHAPARTHRWPSSRALS